MNPTTASLRSEMIEQVMRLTGDDALLVPFLEAEPRSRSAHAALGRLLTEVPLQLRLGCPLMAFVSGTSLDPSWRTTYPPLPDSLWRSYEFLSTLYGSPTAPDPYSGLELLRDSADTDLSA